MDYKKKFEDFLDKMQGLLDIAKKQGHIIVRVEDIENTFPELKESKDEKIRGAILTGLIDCRDAPDLGWSNFGGIPIDDCIAWLEKRRKVDNSNKVESKFNVGDWVVFNNDHESVYQIEEIDNFQYILRHILGGSMLLSFSSEDMIRHWTIQDAKDGDVLVDEDNNIGLYQEEKDGLDDWESYIYLGCDNRLYGFSMGGYHSIKNTKPATKEQSDLLFQKMKEKGYEWDAEKKELKKVEFSPNDLIEESYQQQADDLIDMVTEKSAWSEEDECYMAECINAIATKDGWSFEEKRKTKHWLKSIKERVKPQKQWKPSKEQMEALEHFIVYHNGSTNYAKDLEELRLQLKKLK